MDCTCHQYAKSHLCPLHVTLPSGTHVEADFARDYAGPAGAEDAARRVFEYAKTYGCPERETTVRIARDAAEDADLRAPLGDIDLEVTRSPPSERTPVTDAPPDAPLAGVCAVTYPGVAPWIPEVHPGTRGKLT